MLALSLGGSKAWSDRKTLERFGIDACGVKNAAATVNEVIEKALGYEPENPDSEMWRKIRAQVLAGVQSIHTHKAGRGRRP